MAKTQFDKIIKKGKYLKVPRNIPILNPKLLNFEIEGKKEKLIQKIIEIYAKIPYKIINLLIENGEMSISQLCRETNEDYKNVWRYIKNLSEKGVLKRRNKKQKGVVVLVKL